MKNGRRRFPLRRKDAKEEKKKKRIKGSIALIADSKALLCGWATLRQIFQKNLLIATSQNNMKPAATLMIGNAR